MVKLSVNNVIVYMYQQNLLIKIPWTVVSRDKIIQNHAFKTEVIYH